MAALFTLLMALVIGSIVGAIERRPNEGGEIAAIAIVGAVAGLSIGHAVAMFAGFGEVAGVLCAIAGAIGLVRVYHAQTHGMKIREEPPLFEPGSFQPYEGEATPSPLPPIPVGKSTDSLPRMLAEAIGWAVVAAIATGAAGFAGHLLGSELYPQRYEQIPSDFFFVPLGMLIGFVAAGMARLAMRDSGTIGVGAFVLVVAIGYGGALFQYSRTRALPVRLTSALEPPDPVPMACSPDICPPTDPPCQWYIRGALHIKVGPGIGATIDRLEITSYTESTGSARPGSYKEQAAEAARWRGPLVMLSGRRIAGARDLAPDSDTVLPIVYAYHSPGGVSRRKIMVSVYLTDSAGRSAYTSANWIVQ